MRGLTLLLLGACLAAPAFASKGAHRPQRAQALQPALAALPESTGARILVFDPRSRTTALIYSRSDGFSTKIAWARLERNGWGVAHELTFGSGKDLSPVVGISATGSWLFWRGESGQVFGAPIELSRGHLLAVPALLATGPVIAGRGGAGTGGAGTSSTGPSDEAFAGGNIRPEGGVDIPILVGTCDPINPVYPCVPPDDPGGGTRDTPPQVNPEGGSDIPVVNILVTNPGEPADDSVGVASSPDCDNQFVTSVADRSILMIEIGEEGEVVRQVNLKAAFGVDPDLAAAAARNYYLSTDCR